MKKTIASISSARLVKVIVGLCAGIFFISTAPGQLSSGAPNGRFLFVFDTSAAMKDCVPSERYAVQRLFFSMMNGQLNLGDSIGAWAFDRKLRAGDFPLQPWQPQNAAIIASNVVHFVEHQRYSKSARFDVVVPDINNLVRNSERLTVLIFSDGEEEIKGTPYDQPINSAFKQNRKALKNAKQAFVVVLRSQFGVYTGFTVNASGVGVDFPVFPPLPQPPPPPVPVKTNTPPPPPPAPVVELPPLVIVGTNVGTNLAPLTPPATEISNRSPVKVVSNPPPAITVSNSVANAVTNTTSTASPPAAKEPTNAPVLPEENPSGLTRDGALKISVALLIAAILVIVAALVRSRKGGRSSLISDAMKKK